MKETFRAEKCLTMKTKTYKTESLNIGKGSHPYLLFRRDSNKIILEKKNFFISGTFNNIQLS